MTRLTVLAGLVGASLAILALAGGATRATGAELAPPPTLESGVLSVGTELGYPPFRIYKNGKYSGLELEMVQMIAKNLGFREVKFINTTFDLLLTSVAGKKFDVAADQIFGWARRGTFAYPKVQDRIKLISFGRPYYFPTYVLVTSKKHNPGVKNVGQLKAGMKVAFQKGGADFFWAEKNLVPKGIRLVDKRSFAQTLPALQSGQIDGIVEELLIAIEAEKTRKDLQHGVAINPLSNAGVAMAYHPDANALRKAMNAQLAKMIKSGALRKLYKKWIPGYPYRKLPTSSYTYKG